VEREPLCGSFTACSKKGEIEFDVQSSNTHIVIHDDKLGSLTYTRTQTK
jgi:hypothetical protein